MSNCHGDHTSSACVGILLQLPIAFLPSVANQPLYSKRTQQTILRPYPAETVRAEVKVLTVSQSYWGEPERAPH